MPVLIFNMEVKAPSGGGNLLRWGEKNNLWYNMQSVNLKTPPSWGARSQD